MCAYVSAGRLVINVMHADRSSQQRTWGVTACRSLYFLCVVKLGAYFAAGLPALYAEHVHSLIDIAIAR